MKCDWESQAHPSESRYSSSCNHGCISLKSGFVLDKLREWVSSCCWHSAALSMLFQRPCKMPGARGRYYVCDIPMQSCLKSLHLLPSSAIRTLMLKVSLRKKVYFFIFTLLEEETSEKITAEKQNMPILSYTNFLLL